MELYKSKYFERKKSRRNSDRNEKPFRSFEIPKMIEVQDIPETIEEKNLQL